MAVPHRLSKPNQGFITMFGLFRRNDEPRPQSYEDLREIHRKAMGNHTDDQKLIDRAATAKAREAKGYELWESDREALAEFDQESRKDAPPAPKMTADDDSTWRWW